VTFLTGHTKAGVSELDFPAVVGIGGTLAIYMGLVALPELRDGLLAAGLDPTTPVALIESGGSARQRELVGTLDELVAHAAAWSQGGPALLLVGAAVGRRIGQVTPTE
jgi:uroporphyrin-III C-methyltransferase/precorrin-2 dehydrogenase/sirohydrochlorin ferrochelatase